MVCKGFLTQVNKRVHGENRGKNAIPHARDLVT